MGSKACSGFFDTYRFCSMGRGLMGITCTLNVSVKSEKKAAILTLMVGRIAELSVCLSRVVGCRATSMWFARAFSHAAFSRFLS